MIETFAIVLGIAVVAAGVVVIKHRFWPPSPDDEPREDVAEYIAMMVSVLYALVLGLSLVAVWEARSAAEEHVQAEASAAHQIRLLSAGLPAPAGERARDAVDAYAHHVVSEEWPAMTAGQPPGRRGWDLLDDLRAAGQVPAGATLAQQATLQESLAQLSALDDARRGREADVGESLSPVLWFGLIVGGLLTVAFMFLFGVQRSVTHVVMVMGLTALITFTVLLVFELNQPFNGLFAVDSTPFSRYFDGS
ncbi:bestrophin-like domain [Streptomyces sp. NPDC002343]